MIKLEDVTNEDMILLDLEVDSKEEVIEALVNRMDAAGKLSSKEAYLQSVQEREKLLSTYCGMDIAIPHGISEAVIEPGICFARIKEIGWGDPECKVHFIFLLAVPKRADGQNPEHISLLSAIAVSSLDEGNRALWEAAKTEKEILESLEPALHNLESEA